MAEKSFGVKEVNLIGASGTPSITSPNNLNLNAVNVAISTNVSIGGTLSVTGNVSVGGTLTYEDVTNIDSVGIVTAREGIFIPDDKEVKIGNTASNPDIKIFHQSSSNHSFIDNTTGNLYIRGGGQVISLQATNVSHSVQCNPNSWVKLYNAGSEKLSTTSSGVTVTGTLTATTFSGSGASLTNLPVADSDIQVAYTVTANGSSAYRFAGNGVVSTADNPDLYLIRGQKYRFINNSGGSHPFQIREASGGTAYSTGVTNNGAASGNIDFAPTYDSPAQLVYQCTAHGGMVGNIYLRDAAGNNTNVGVTTFSGAVNISGDLSIADKIIHTGDTNCFISFPAADQIVFEGGGHERFRINGTTGRYLFGRDITGRAANYNNTSVVPIIQLEDDTEASISVAKFSNSTDSSRIYLQKGRGTTGSASVVQDNDTLGMIVFNGYNGSGFRNAAQILAEVDGTPTSSGDDTDMPGALVFKTSEDGTNVPTERLRITSDGKIGIGTDSPDSDAYIHIVGPDNRKIILEDNDNNGANLRKNYIGIQGSDNLVLAADEADLGTSSSIRFRIDNTEKVRITSAGRVGIGTDSPDEKLHVYNGAGDVTSFVEAIAGDALLNLSNSGNGNYSGINFIRERGSGQTGRNGGSIFMPSNTSNNEAFLYIQAQSTSAQAGVTGALSANNGVRLKLHGDDGIFSIETGDSERLRIDSDGNVIVNDTTAAGNVHPDTKLHVKGGITFRELTSASEGALPAITQWSNNGTSQDLAIGTRSSSGSVIFFTGNSGTDGDWNGTSNAERLRITSDGQTKLNIASNSALTEPLIIRNGGTGSGTNVGMIFYNGNESSTGAGALARIKAIDVGSFDSDLTFETGLKSGFSNSTDERFRITSNGQLRSQGNNNGNAVGMELRNNNTAAYSHAELALTSQNATTSKVWCDVPNAGLRFQYNGGTAVKINQSGNLVMASGSGIDFSATGDGGTASSELFDDYEEGSYIPTVSFSGTTYTYGASNDYVFRSPHSTSNSNSISYTKIGSRVFVNFAIFWNSTVTARYVITLPFTFRGSAYQLCTTPAFYQVNISGDMLGTLGAGSAAFDTYRITNDTSSGGHGNIPLSNASEVYYMICYETTE